MPRKWQQLSAGGCGASANIEGVDASLVWADATGFADFLHEDEAPLALVPVIVELKRGADKSDNPLERLRKQLKRLKAGRVTPIYGAHGGQGIHYCTAWFTPGYCKAVLSRQPVGVGEMIERFELQMPVLPERPRQRLKPTQLKLSSADRGRAGKTLLGVIDSGCPFAHRSLRDAKGHGTRILSLWDQGPNPAFTRASCGGQRPADFGYGCEIHRDQLNALMDRHRMATGVDEDGCYAEAGDALLRRRVLHGAAVLGLLAGPSTLGARREAEPGGPPTWKRAHDTASRSDIVFVQLPGDDVQDSSSAALVRHLLDGIRYILSCAGKGTKRIVINISDASNRGTHDGGSIFERALTELVQEQNAQKRQLHIVFPAGNGFDEQRHAQLEPPKRSPSEVAFRLLPGNEAPAQVFVRVPPKTPGLQIRLIPPGPGAVASPWVSAGQAVGLCDVSSACCSGIVFPRPAGDTASMAMLAFNPTAVTRLGRLPAPAGVWRIEVKASPAATEVVHLYIARGQLNIGALRRSQQARFVDVDETYDPERPLRYGKQDPEPPRSAVRRNGSLSSLATGPTGAGVTVVGGYFLRGGAPSNYSSGGPAAAGRFGPDLAAACDESHALTGIRSAGCRSAEVVRMVGTSFAAPQVARVLINQGKLPALTPPPTPVDPRRSGAGHLPPSPD